MRVPDVILKSVGFVGQVLYQDANTINVDWQGTGFFISIPGRLVPSMRFSAFVTAMHIAKDLKGKNICFGVNKRTGGIATLTNTQGSWWFHPSDKTADVAVLPFSPEPDLEIVSVPIADFLTREMMVKKNIGIGDEVFMTGLFDFVPSDYTENRRNMPIVRHGNIAMLPDVPIQTEYGFAEVFLVEARSIGGISGSPVFARQTVAIPVKTPEGEAWLHGLDGFYLLGLMQGHWDIKESEINEPHPRHDRRQGVNMGIGIVVPASKIMETINRPELLEMREEREKQRLREITPTMDSGAKQ